VDSGPEDLQLFNVLIKSMLTTIHDDYLSDKFHFAIYLGVDYGDPIYDNHEKMDQVQQIFRAMTQDYHIDLVVKKFGRENRGAPAWFWNGLFERALEDGCDYSYQLNDDIELQTSGIGPCFIYLFMYLKVGRSNSHRR